MQQNTRPRRTSAEIKNLLAEFSASGKTAKEFCAQHDITEAGFYKWRIRYLPKAPEMKNDFVMLQPPASCPAGLFAEVHGIRLYQAVSPSYLKELLA